MQVGCADILSRIVEDLKDESEPYRRMVMETIDKVVSDLGTADVDARLEELLIDGILYAFQEQVSTQSPVQNTCLTGSTCVRLCFVCRGATRLHPVTVLLSNVEASSALAMPLRTQLPGGKMGVD